MSAEEYRFRSATFGFNRQDVIQYIENVHHEYAAKLQEAEKALEAERGARANVEERQSLAGQEAAAAGEDAQRAKTDLAEAMEALENVRRERDELLLKLQALEKEYADLQVAAEQMAPAARAYDALKEKAAGIELEAHSRADAILRDSERQADRTRQELAAWVRRVESSYSRFKADVSATLSHAMGELDRTSRSLSSVAEELEGQGSQLRAIVQEATESAKNSPLTFRPESHT